MAAKSGTGAEVESAAASEPSMLAALQSTHQHADAKAGIVMAAQATLVGTAGPWNRQAVRAWEQGGAVGLAAGVLLTVFAAGLVGGAVCLALALRPRLLRPTGPNRYSFAGLALGTQNPHTADSDADRAARQLELSEAVRFLARVALLKHQFLIGAVLCTAAMGASAGMFLTLRPLLV